MRLGSKGGDGRRTISRGKRATTVRLKGSGQVAEGKDNGPDEGTFESLVKKADGVKRGIRARVATILSARTDKLARDTWNDRSGELEFDEQNLVFDPDLSPAYDDTDYDNNPVLLPSKINEFKRNKESVKSASLIVTLGIPQSESNSIQQEGYDPLSHRLNILQEEEEEEEEGLEESKGPDDRGSNSLCADVQLSGYDLWERKRKEEDAAVVTADDKRFIEGLKKQISMADIPLVQSTHHSRVPADLLQQEMMSSDNVKKYFGPDARRLFYDTYKSLAKTAQICSGGIDELQRYVSDPDGNNPFVESAKIMVVGGVISPRKTADADRPTEAMNTPADVSRTTVHSPKAQGSHEILTSRHATDLGIDESEAGSGTGPEVCLIQAVAMDSSFDAEIQRLLEEAPDEDAAEDATALELVDDDLGEPGDAPVAVLRLNDGEELVDNADTLLDMEREVLRLQGEEEDEDEDEFGTERELYPCSVHGCNVPSQFFCSGCNEVTYCSQEHQYVHWEVHSTMCQHSRSPATHRSGRYRFLLHSLRGSPYNAIAALYRGSMCSARIETARARPLTDEEAYREDIPFLSSHRPQSPRATFILGLMRLGVAPRAVAMLRKSMVSTLNVTNMGLGDRLAEAFSSSVHKLPGVRGLNVSNNSLSDKGMTAVIKNLSKMESLQDLDLSSNVVGERAAQALAEYLASGGCKIKRLKLTHANVDDVECDRFVSALMTNAYLEELDLSHNLLGKSESLNEVNPDFTTAGESLGLLLKSSTVKLKRLLLRWNMVRMGGAVVLCESLKLNQSLVHLDLAFNKIGTAAAVTLGASLLNEGFSLEYLNLQNNLIDGKAAIAVIIGAKYSGIKDLVLDDNPIGEQGCRVLIQTVRDFGDRINISCKKCDVLIHYTDTLVDFGQIKGSYTLNCEDKYERLLAYELLDIIPRSNAHVVQKATLSDGRKLSLPESRTKKKFGIHDPALEEIKKLKYLSEFLDPGVYPHVLQLFHSADKRAEGCLRDRDLRHVFMKMGLHYHLHEVRDIIRMFDTNGNGVIELEELVQFLKHLSRYSAKLLKSLSSTSNTCDIKAMLKVLVQAGPTTITINIAEKWDFSIDYDHHITSSTQLKCMIAAADQSLNPAKVMGYAAEAVGTILYYNEAKEFMTYFIAVESEVVGLTHVLPCMESVDDAVHLVKKFLDMNISKRLMLENALGSVYKVCTGNYNGMYFIDFSKRLDRITFRKLLIASHTFAEIASRKGMFDISDTGDKSSFRNAYFHEKYAYVNSTLTEILPVPVSEQRKHVNEAVVKINTVLSFVAAFNGIPDKGRIDFDFSAVGNFDSFFHYRGISDAKFLRVLAEGSLCEKSDIKDLQGKMASVDHSSLYRDLADLNGLLHPEQSLDQLDAIKHMRHMLKYKEHRRTEVIDKKAFMPPEHEDDHLSASSLDEASAQLPDDLSGQFSVDSAGDASSHKVHSMPLPTMGEEHVHLTKESFSESTYSKLSFGEMLGVSTFVSEGQKRAQRGRSGAERVLTIQDSLRAVMRNRSCNSVWKCKVIFEYLSVQLFHRSIFVRQLLILVDLLEEFDVPSKCLYASTFRIELIVTFFPKVIDTHNMHVVYQRLKPVDQAAFMFRIGVIRTFNVFKPEGHHFFDLSYRDQRIAFKLLLFLSKVESSTHALTGEYSLTGRTDQLHRLEINPNYWLKEGIYESAIYRISFLPKNAQASKLWLQDVRGKLVTRYKLLVCGALNSKLLLEDISAGKIQGEAAACLLGVPAATTDDVSAILDRMGIEWRFD